MAERREDNIENNSSGDEVPGQTAQNMCQPCSSKDKQTAADVYCSTCDEFQCNECSSVHETYGFMKNHKLVSAKDAKTKVKSFFDMSGLDQCEQHRKFLKLFCEDENQLCCSTCAIVDHRKCHSVVEVQKLAENAKSTDFELKGKFREIKSKAEMVVNHIRSSKEQLNRDVKMIPIKIKKVRDDVIQMFDDLEASVSNKVESFQRDTIDKLTRKQKSCEKHVSEVTESLETIDSVFREGTPSQQFIMGHKMKKRVEELDTNVEEESLNIETVTVTFDFDETLKLPPPSNAEYAPGRLTLKCAIPEALKLTKIMSINVTKSTGDVGEPLYSGLDFLPDGRLVAVDNKNKTCLIFNTELEKLGSYQLSYPPQSVVAISEEEVAITSCRYKIEILHVSKFNEITLVRTSAVSTKYKSICMKDDANFVAGTVDCARPVRILSLSGEEKDFKINFPNKKYSTTTSACTYIRSREKVVLTDKDENTVYIYDIATNTKIVVKDDQIKQPLGVAVGPSDCCLVCSWQTCSIVQISPTGRILSSYKLGNNYPYRISVSNDKSSLAIGTASDSDNKLQLFKLAN